MILLPPVERCVKQVAERTGHGFRDEAATRNMHKQFADAPIAGRHVVADPWASVDAIVDRLSVALRRGDLRYRVERTDGH
jgi:hypothetical protein